MRYRLSLNSLVYQRNDRSFGGKGPMKLRPSNEATTVMTTGTTSRATTAATIKRASRALRSSAQRFISGFSLGVPAPREGARGEEHDDQGDHQEADRQGAAARVVRHFGESGID